MKVLVIFGALSALAQTGFAKCIPSPLPSSTSDYTAAPASSDSSDYMSVPVSSDTSDYAEVPAPSDTSDYAEVPASSDSSDYTEAPASSNYIEASAAGPSSNIETQPAPLPTYVTSSAPQSPEPQPSSGTSVYQLTEAKLDAAVPKAKGQGLCTGASDTSCANNKRAIVALNNAAKTYGITERSEMVAIISLMAYESGSWQYNINVSPGRAGQGTKAMLMYNFIYEYAKELYPSKVQDAWENTEDESTMNQVRELVLNDNDSFGSGFWYLVNKASSYHNSKKLVDGDLDSFKQYCETAVGATWDESRGQIWETVNNAL
ncbi:hypothetical protein IWW36_002418 [Coemansia brasiliensis]|uniref:Uncharacterized protein n=1 Tax=Coemansia brasiliensis TaxID=2650707 RepID=A0A9W8I745_9FUNG|nr:hypothetical protein IWW36_002418 [Coemansia brasiliensis]